MLISRPLSEMTDEELMALVAHQRELSQVPGALRVKFKDESVEIKTGKRSSRKKQNDILDLL